MMIAVSDELSHTIKSLKETLDASRQQATQLVRSVVTSDYAALRDPLRLNGERDDKQTAENTLQFLAKGGKYDSKSLEDIKPLVSETSRGAIDTLIRLRDECREKQPMHDHLNAGLETIDNIRRFLNEFNEEKASLENAPRDFFQKPLREGLTTAGANMAAMPGMFRQALADIEQHIELPQGVQDKIAAVQPVIGEIGRLAEKKMEQERGK